MRFTPSDVENIILLDEEKYKESMLRRFPEYKDKLCPIQDLHPEVQ